jgi:hypothetical protein
MRLCGGRNAPTPAPQPPVRWIASAVPSLSTHAKGGYVTRDSSQRKRNEVCRCFSLFRSKIAKGFWPGAVHELPARSAQPTLLDANSEIPALHLQAYEAASHGARGVEGKCWRCDTTGPHLCAETEGSPSVNGDARNRTSLHGYGRCSLLRRLRTTRDSCVCVFERECVRLNPDFAPRLISEPKPGVTSSYGFDGRHTEARWNAHPLSNSNQGAFLPARICSQAPVCADHSAPACALPGSELGA